MEKTTKERMEELNTVLMQITLFEASVMNLGKALADCKREGETTRALLRQEVQELRRE